MGVLAVVCILMIIAMAWAGPPPADGGGCECTA